MTVTINVEEKEAMEEEGRNRRRGGRTVRHGQGARVRTAYLHALPCPPAATCLCPRTRGRRSDPLTTAMREEEGDEEG